MSTGMIPGGCVPFSGSFGGTNNRHPIPRGSKVPDTSWVLCDGGSDGTGGKVPDLRNRFILSAGSTYPSGSKGGSSTHTHALAGTVGHTTLNENAMPNHAHTSYGTRHGRNGQSPGNALFGCDGDTQTGTNQWSQGTGASGSHTHSLAANTGGTSNMPPYYALAYIMKL